MLFICCSPYHVFNAIHYMWHIDKGKENDLIILGLFFGAKDLAEKVRRSGVFTNVYYTEKPDVEINKYRKFIAMKRMLFPRKTIEYFLPEYPYREKKYSKIVSSTYMADIVVVFAEYFSKQGCLLDVIEDGTGTYLYGAAGYSKSQKIFSKVTGKGIPALKHGKMWVYEKELLQKSIDMPVDNLPKINLSKHEKEIINAIFGGNSAEFPNKYIFLCEGPYPGGVEWEEQVRTLDLIANIVGKDNIVVKPHPKNDISLLKEYNVLPQNIPWELYCVNNDMREKIIFVTNSTAAYSPKIIFNEEAKVVFLSRFYDITSPLANAFLEMQDGLKELYERKEYIYFPKTKEELERLLIKFS